MVGGASRRSAASLFWGSRKLHFIGRWPRPLNPAPTAQAAPVSVAPSCRALRRAAHPPTALLRAGMDRTQEAPGVAEFLSECAGRTLTRSCSRATHTSRRALAADPCSARSPLRTTCLVVVSSASDGSGLSQALNAGADGVVFEKDLESTLGPVTQSVLVGQISLPRRFHRCVVKPVFSHREKEVLTMVVQGLAKRQISDPPVSGGEHGQEPPFPPPSKRSACAHGRRRPRLRTHPQEGLEAVLSIESEERLYGDAGAVGRERRAGA